MAASGIISVGVIVAICWFICLVICVLCLLRLFHRQNEFPMAHVYAPAKYVFVCLLGLWALLTIFLDLWWMGGKVESSVPLILLCVFVDGLIRPVALTMIILFMRIPVSAYVSDRQGVYLSGFMCLCPPDEDGAEDEDEEAMDDISPSALGTTDTSPSHQQPQIHHQHQSLNQDDANVTQSRRGIGFTRRSRKVAGRTPKEDEDLEEEEHDDYRSNANTDDTESPEPAQVRQPDHFDDAAVANNWDGASTMSSHFDAADEVPSSGGIFAFLPVVSRRDPSSVDPLFEEGKPDWHVRARERLVELARRHRYVRIGFIILAIHFAWYVIFAMVAELNETRRNDGLQKCTQATTGVQACIVWVAGSPHNDLGAFRVIPPLTMSVPAFMVTAIFTILFAASGYQYYQHRQVNAEAAEVFSRFCCVQIMLYLVVCGWKLILLFDSVRMMSASLMTLSFLTDILQIISVLLFALKAARVPMFGLL